MRFLPTTFILVARCCLGAGLEVVADPKPQAVFAGGAQVVTVTLHNPAPHPAAQEFSTRLYQLASDISAPVGGSQPWKKVELLAGQTAQDQATITVPDVRAATRFRLQLLDDVHEPAGRVELVAIPRDALKQLGALTGGERIAVFDPENHLQPLLESAGLAVGNLDAGEGTPSAGALAIFGPFSDRAHLPEGTAERARALAVRGVAVIALLPIGSFPTMLIPPSHPEGAKLIIAPAAPFLKMENSPQAILDIILLTRLALGKTADLPLREWLESAR